MSSEGECPATRSEGKWFSPPCNPASPLTCPWWTAWACCWSGHKSCLTSKINCLTTKASLASHYLLFKLYAPGTTELHPPLFGGQQVCQPWTFSTTPHGWLSSTLNLTKVPLFFLTLSRLSWLPVASSAAREYALEALPLEKEKIC